MNAKRAVISWVCLVCSQMPVSPRIEHLVQNHTGNKIDSIWGIWCIVNLKYLMHGGGNFIQRLSHVWKSPPATVTPFTVVLLEYVARVKFKDANSANNDGTAYRLMF